MHFGKLVQHECHTVWGGIQKIILNSVSTVFSCYKYCMSSLHLTIKTLLPAAPQSLYSSKETVRMVISFKQRY